jgi:uncharacterized protein
VRRLKAKAIRWFLLIALVPLVAMFSLVANALIAVPPLQGHLTDLTKTLNAEQAQAIEQSLTAFENRKGTQIAILILPSTGPEPIEPFSIRVAEKWKIGRKRQDDGVILVIAKSDRTVRIEVGYGLEGVLTDLYSQRIITDILLAHFKRNDFYGGITAGIADIIQRIDQEPTAGESSSTEPLTKTAPDEAPHKSPGGTPIGTPIGTPDWMSNLPMILIGALLVGGVLRLIFGRIPGALITGVLVTLIAWFVIGALFFAVVAGTVALGLTLWGGGLLGIAARLLGGAAAVGGVEAEGLGVGVSAAVAGALAAAGVRDAGEPTGVLLSCNRHSPMSDFEAKSRPQLGPTRRQSCQLRPRPTTKF